MRHFNLSYSVHEITNEGKIPKEVKLNNIINKLAQLTYIKRCTH